MEREVGALPTSTSCYVRCKKCCQSCLFEIWKFHNSGITVATMTVLCQAGHNGVLAPGEEHHHHHYNQHHTSLTLSMFIK